LQLSRHRHGSLFCPASRFTHFAFISLQGFAALNTFRSIPASFVSATCSPSAASVWARLLVAAGCGFITVFALATVTFSKISYYPLCSFIYGV